MPISSQISNTVVLLPSFIKSTQLSEGPCFKFRIWQQLPTGQKLFCIGCVFHMVRCISKFKLDSVALCAGATTDSHICVPGNMFLLVNSYSERGEFPVSLYLFNWICTATGGKSFYGIWLDDGLIKLVWRYWLSQFSGSGHYASVFSLLKADALQCVNSFNLNSNPRCLDPKAS